MSSFSSSFSTQSASCSMTASCGLGFVLRLFLAYEFFEAGLSKLNGENWFASIQESSHSPLTYYQPILSWAIASGAEILLPILLTLGLSSPASVR